MGGAIERQVELRPDYKDLERIKGVAEDIYDRGEEQGWPEVVALFERGVAYDRGRRVWVPSGYLEQVKPVGGGRWVHDMYVHHEVEADGQWSRVAGTVQTIVATVKYVEHQLKLGVQVPAIMLGAGRAGYLQEAISQGLAPKGFFAGQVVEAELRGLMQGGFWQAHPIEIVTYPENTNSLDDLRGFVRTAHMLGVRRVTGVTVASHAERVEWLKTIVLRELAASELGMRVKSTEELLRQFDAGEYRRIADLAGSVAVRQTEADDEKGVVDFLAGRYMSTQPVATR